MGVLQWFNEAATEGLEKAFLKIGRFIADKPSRTIVGCLVLTVLCGAGWIRLEVENRPEKLYTPQNSVAFKDSDWVKSNFGDQVVLFDRMYTKGDNLLGSRDTIRDMFRFHTQTETSLRGGQLQDICLKGQDGGCVCTSPLGWWDYDLARFEADPDWVGTLSQEQGTDRSTFDGKLPISVLGGATRDAAGRLTSVKVFQMQWVIYGSIVTEGRDTTDPVAAPFEEAFDDSVYGFSPCCGNTLYSATEFQFEEAVDASFSNDALLTTVSYIFLSVYACVVLTSGNRVFSKATIGLVAVLSVGLAVTSGFGLIIGFGVPFSLVVSAVAFVMLGLGVDDAFVVISCLREEDPNQTPKERVMGALSKAGPSITLTSITDFAAFAVGASTIIPALRAFCIFAAVTILFDFFFQCTFFIAFLKFDEDRVERDGGDCCCLTSSKSSRTKQLCSKEPYDNQKDTGLRLFIAKVVPDVILHPLGKVAVLLLATGLLSAGIVGITRLELDFNYEWFVPEGTAAKRAVEIEAAYFQSTPIEVTCYTGAADYFGQREQLVPYCGAIANSAEIDAASVSCWYAEFEASSGGAGANATTATAFYSAIRRWQATGGSRFASNLIWDASNSTLVATGTSAQLVPTTNLQGQIDQMRAIRNTVNEFTALEPRAFSYVFFFWEGSAVIYGETIRNVILALIVVFFTTLVFLADIGGAAIVLLTISLVDVCILGFIHWWGMHMNTVIAVNLILAIGLTVDYSAHIAHAYMKASGTRDERARRALEHIGYSVFQGGMTTLVATMALIPAQSYVFQVFFKCFVMIVLFGQFFGLLVLPVLLSLIGPVKSFASVHGKVEPSKNANFAGLTGI